MQDRYDLGQANESNYKPAEMGPNTKMIYPFLFILLLLTGCGPSQTQRDLTGVAMEYHQYVSETNSPPDSVESLANFQNPYPDLPLNKAQSNAMKRALASGDYVVYWNYNVAADLQRNTTVILAYHKDTPKSGGLVAFADATVRSITKEEFENASKASEFSSE